MPRGKRRKATGGKPAQWKQGGGRPAGRSGGIGMALASLKTVHAELLDQRCQLDGQIQAVEQVLAVMGGRPAPKAAAAQRGGRRPRGAGSVRPDSLKAHVLDVLSGGGVMSVKDITAAVVQSGYKSKNKTLAKSVGIALKELPQVHKIKRGKFRLK